jgi:hypothetical protein
MRACGQCRPSRTEKIDGSPHLRGPHDALPTVGYFVVASQNTTAALSIRGGSWGKPCAFPAGCCLRSKTRAGSRPKELVALIHGIVRVANTSSRAAADVHRLEEQVLGDPTVVAEATNEMSVDEAVEILLAGERRLARILRRAAETGQPLEPPG